jgi:hypothetical protein
VDDYLISQLIANVKGGFQLQLLVCTSGEQVLRAGPRARFLLGRVFFRISFSINTKR